MVDQSWVAVLVANRWVRLETNELGFVPRSTHIDYTSPNCSRLPFLTVEGIVTRARLAGQTIYAPSGLPTTTNLRSALDIDVNGTPIGCRPQNEIHLAAPLVIIDVASLGFVPPFQVTR